MINLPARAAAATAFCLSATLFGTSALGWDRVVFDTPLSTVPYQTKGCEDFLADFSFRLYGYEKDTTYWFEGREEKELDMFLIDVIGLENTEANRQQLDRNEKVMPAIGLYTMIASLPKSHEGRPYPNSSEYLVKTYGDALAAGSTVRKGPVPAVVAARPSTRYQTLTRQQKEDYLWVVRVRDYKAANSERPTTTVPIGYQQFIPCRPATPPIYIDAVASDSTNDIFRIQLKMLRTDTQQRNLPDWKKGTDKFTLMAKKNGEQQVSDVTDLVPFRLYTADSRRQPYNGGSGKNAIYNGMRYRLLTLDFNIDPSITQLRDMQLSYKGGDVNKFGDPSEPAVLDVAGQYNRAR